MRQRRARRAILPRGPCARGEAALGAKRGRPRLLDLPNQRMHYVARRTQWGFPPPAAGAEREANHGARKEISGPQRANPR